MKKFIVLMVVLVAVLFSLSARGQVRVEDPSVLPVAPVYRCKSCIPYDVKDLQVSIALYDIALKNWNLCQIFGKNQWDHEANEHNCGKGQGHIFNDYGEFATYLYMGFNPYDAHRNFQAGLLYYKPNFVVDKLK